MITTPQEVCWADSTAQGTCHNKRENLEPFIQLVLATHLYIHTHAHTHKHAHAHTQMVSMINWQKEHCHQMHGKARKTCGESDARTDSQTGQSDDRTKRRDWKDRHQIETDSEITR